MIAVSRWIPSRRSGDPKVKRAAPLCRSIPTVAIISPIDAERMPFTADPSTSVAVATNAKIMRVKYSAGPREIARWEPGRARKERERNPADPQKKEQTAKKT